MKKEKRRVHRSKRKPTSREPVREHQFPEAGELIDTGVQGMLEACRRAYEDGFLVAVYEALLVCQEHNIKMPNWLLTALLDVLGRAYSSRSVGLPKLKRQMQHYRRWLAVHVLWLKGMSQAKAFTEARAILGEHVTAGAIEKDYRRIDKLVKTSDSARQILFVLNRVADRLGVERLDIDKILR